MRDLPVFSTQFGVASLVFSQIPYTKTAYIRIQDTREAKDFMTECVTICQMAGAEIIYAAGHEICREYPYSTAIVAMQADKMEIGATDACLFPVTEWTLEQWRGIYNEKVIRVPNGAWMTLQDGEKMLQEGSGYFVHRDGLLLGIGKVDGNQLQWLAAVYPGGGADVVKALCSIVEDDTVTLEVADTNHKAMELYGKMGFIPVKTLSEWYRVK